MFNKKEWEKEYRKKNRDKLIQYGNEYRERNKIKCIKCCKEYRQKNEEKIRQRNKEYNKKNKEKISKHRKEYRNKNRKKLSKYTKEYQKKNKEKISKRMKEYYQRNKKRINIRTNRYNKKNRIKINNYECNKRKNDVKFNLDGRICGMIYRALKGNKAGRHWEILVGYTVKQLKEHLQKKFKKGMTWTKFMAGEIHIDHVVPKSHFKYTTSEELQFKECWALHNLQPLWAKDNLAKGNRNYQIPLILEK